MPPPPPRPEPVAFSVDALLLVEAFAEDQPFPLDPFQVESARHLAEGRSVLVAAPTGTGKALAATTPVLTPLGWKPISEVCVGDYVIGSQGKPVTVLGVYPQGKRPAYRVTFSDGVSAICDIDHLWAVNTKWRRSKGLPWHVLTLRQIMAEGLTNGEGRRHFIPIMKPVELCKFEAQRNTSLSSLRQETGITQRHLAALLGISQGFVAQRELGHKVASERYRRDVEVALVAVGPQPHLEPYLLGLLLGDGNFSTGVVRFTSADDEIIASVRKMLPRGTILQKDGTRPYDWYILSHKVRTRNPVVTELVKLNLMGHRAEDKFIPQDYKWAPIRDRLAILQGLLDSDGSIDERGIIEYTTVSQVLAEDVAFLVRSLGGRTRIHEKPTNRQLAYRLNITMPTDLSPFRLTRKLARCRSERKYYPTRSIDAVELVGEAEMVCISVDAPDGLFVINDFIVTHNTVVAEFGIWLARRAGLRAIYTAPLKALSNQKFRDLRERYGADQVGLLTGDIVENPRAPIVVMTTEIYRNMLLEGLRAANVATPTDADTVAADMPHAAPINHAEPHAADDALAATPRNAIAADDVAELARRAALDEELSTVGCVVFDELHYLSDPGRGPVWEEAIIHSPAHVTFVGLSATVSNADELRRWIEHVHGPMSLVFHTERAVPLVDYYFIDGALHLVRDADGKRVERFPDVGGEAKLARMRDRGRRFDFNGPNAGAAPSAMPNLKAILATRTGTLPKVKPKAPHGAPTPPATSDGDTPERSPEQPKERQAPEAGETLTALRDAGLLPCLYFLPGRRAAEVAAESAKGHLLVTPEQRAKLHAEVQAWVQRLPTEDQKLDQVQRLAALLPRGLAFHHAGLLPGLKMMVESLFQRGELRAIFATDTLALGINMPARSVVLGSLSKFDGTQMRLLTPNEYQQVTGRAGRRGMDANGAAIIPYSPWDAFEPAFNALTAPLLPVTSAFTVRYNTVLNLWRPNDMQRLRTAVAASLREYQRRGGKMERRPEVEFDLDRPRGRHSKPPRPEEPYRLSRAAAAELHGTVDVLRHLGHIGPDDALTVKGRLLRALFHPAGLILADLLVGGAFDGLTPAELAEAMSWFTFDDDRSLRNFDQLSQRLVQLRREVYRVQRYVLTAESEEGLALSPQIVDGFHGVALNWHRGFSLGGLLRRIELAEGDLLVILNQTIDIIQQVQGAVGQVLDARELWREAGSDTRYGRFLVELRERLELLRPTLGAAWRGMVRGSVAQSRTIPSMSTPLLALPGDMLGDAPSLVTENASEQEHVDHADPTVTPPDTASLYTAEDGPTSGE